MNQSHLFLLLMVLLLDVALQDYTKFVVIYCSPFHACVTWIGYTGVERHFQIHLQIRANSRPLISLLVQRKITVWKKGKPSPLLFPVAIKQPQVVLFSGHPPHRPRQLALLSRFYRRHQVRRKGDEILVQSYPPTETTRSIKYHISRASLPSLFLWFQNISLRAFIISKFKPSVFFY